MEIIYVDSLFLLNLIIDYLLLVITFRLCALPIRRLRCLIGAIVGGAYAVMCFVPGFEFLGTPVFKIALWIAISLIAFGGEEALLKCALSFLTVSAVFGGGVWGASMLIGGSYAGAVIRLDLGMLIFAFAVCYAFLSLSLSRKMRARGGELVAVKIVLRGKTAELTALRDSGNSLREQISGKMVLAVGVNELKELFSEDELMALSIPNGADALLALGNIHSALRFRPVLYSALGVSAGIIPAFTPQELWINGRKTSDYVIGVSPVPVGGGEFCAVI